MHLNEGAVLLPDQETAKDIQMTTISPHDPADTGSLTRFTSLASFQDKSSVAILPRAADFRFL
jgi:hypothetical protein